LGGEQKAEADLRDAGGRESRWQIERDAGGPERKFEKGDAREAEIAGDSWRAPNLR